MLVASEKNGGKTYSVFTVIFLFFDKTLRTKRVSPAQYFVHSHAHRIIRPQLYRFPESSCSLYCIALKRFTYACPVICFIACTAAFFIARCGICRFSKRRIRIRCIPREERKDRILIQLIRS